MTCKASIMRFIVLMAFALACGDAAPADLDGGADGSRPDVDPPCGECDAVAFSLEIDGEPVNDGDVVDWVWGFQGGTMIVPLIVFSDGVVAGETIQVEVRHEPDPDAPDLFGEAADFRGPETYFWDVRRDGDGRFVAGPINDQLGWTGLDGMRLIHDVTVTAARGTANSRLALEMATMPPDACDAFALDSGGPGSCPYRVIPGNARVTVGDPNPSTGDCTDARSVSLEFVPDLPDEAVACAELRGADFDLLGFTVGAGMDPPAGCLDSVGLIDGATVRVDVWVIERGGCSPQLLQLETDTSLCDEMCF